LLFYIPLDKRAIHELVVAFFNKPWSNLLAVSLSTAIYALFTTFIKVISKEYLQLKSRPKAFAFH